jgi:hypothetical protein
MQRKGVQDLMLPNRALSPHDSNRCDTSRSTGNPLSPSKHLPHYAMNDKLSIQQQSARASKSASASAAEQRVIHRRHASQNLPLAAAAEAEADGETRSSSTTSSGKENARFGNIRSCTPLRCICVEGRLTEFALDSLA